MVDAPEKKSGFEAPNPASALALVALGNKGDQVPMQRNDDLIRLIHHLTVLEGGWWSWLSEACQATCDLLHADHACIAVLSTVDFWAATAACAGLGAAAAAGRAYSSDPRFNGSAPAAMLRLQQECPSQVLLFRSAGAAQSASASVPAADPIPAPPAGAGAAGLSSRGSDSTPAASPCPSQEPLRGPDPDLPGDWQLLAEEHGLTQFAAVALVNADMDIVGVLSLASKGPCRPSGWTPEALHSAVGLMAPHIRRAQAVLASPALSQLHAAATFSDLVNAVAEAAVEAAAAVAYVRGQSRVAFMGENLAAAAIFQQQKQEGESSTAQPPLLKARRSSCEFVPTRRGPCSSTATASTTRKLTGTTTATMSVAAYPRLSIDVASGIAERTLTVTTDRTTTAGGDNLKRESWTQNQGVATLPSFTFPSSRGTCKGHTLTLGKTLLSEALSKQVAGLCIDDCQAYTVSMKAYPRDLVLSRGAVMPLSLALATTAVDCGFSPRMALYVTYGTCLPRPLLQAVVQELQQLLQAMLPILKTRLSGGILLEYEYLTLQLQEAVHRKAKPTAPANGVSGDACEDPQSFPPHEGRMLSFILGAGMGSNVPGAKGTAGGGTEAGGGPCGGGAAAATAAGSEAATVQQGPFARISLNSRAASPPHARGTAAAAAAVNAAAVNAAAAAAAGAADRPPSLVAPHTPTATSVASHAHALGLTPAHSGSQAANATRSGEISFQPTVAGAPPLGSGGAVAAGVAAAAAEAEALEGDIDMELATRRRAGSGSLLSEPPMRPQSACEVDLEVAGRLRARLGVRSVSFRLEAAQAPRGASKLAPLIASMHDRLKTAQAAQMTFVRSEAHKTDLKSLRLLQEIGQGGYGTVYRGLFHGTEVAVKIIKQSRLAGVQSSSNLMASSQCLGLHKQNLHDAIELVASVSMSHINIVQVPAYFMDVRLEKPEEFNPLDSVDQPTESRPFRLVHSPSLLESPAPGQEGQGAGDFAMALVLEYCDCGSLCDAILNRKFIERVTPKKPPAGANGSAPPKTYLAINMRSVYLTLLEIALALRHMHSLALVHCDLKPQNVLLKSSPRDPRGFTAKLSDFGLAKMMAHDDEGQLVIDEAVASGTITHVAPEVLLGQKALGAAVDIYAFGILMFQVLCGMKVYDKTMSASAIANSVAHRFMRPQLPSWVPSSYRALAQACWHHVPSSRPTADELVRHLERALEAKRGSSSSSSTANAGGSSSTAASAAAGTSGRHQQPRAPAPALAPAAAAAAAQNAGL
ncbi:hypothetical protein PLESTF_001893600 [Pleodorina starrii]|nr:hypothetical protein PLESTF_001893600 [Pleodorina starrii]